MSENIGSAPPWVEVIMVGPQEAADAWADFIYSTSGQGVLVEEVADSPGLVRVKGYLGFSAEIVAQRAALDECFASLKAQWPDSPLELSFSDLADEDWSANWKKHFKPRRVTWHLIVTPPWEEAHPDPNQKVMVIDPGQAFGTGQHESTLLCLRRLERLNRKSKLPAAMLDVGCGTGILAMAALLMGAQRAVALDNDPLALEATAHNVGLNNLTERMEISDTPLADISEDFSLIMANLTANDLCELAPLMAPRLKSGGEIVVSGLLVEQVDRVREAFEAQGLAMLERDSMSGWAMLVLG